MSTSLRRSLLAGTFVLSGALVGLALPAAAQSSGSQASGSQASSNDASGGSAKADGTKAGEPSDSTVIAKVGDKEITELDLKAASAEMGDRFAQLPQDKQRLAILSAVVDIVALSEEAEKAGLQKQPEVAAEIKFQRERALHNAYFAKNGLDGITDAELKARYDKEVAAMPDTEEVHARHILLKTKDEAEKAIKKLEGGESFEKVAKEMSTGPSAQNGGDLGFFEKGQMVPAFEKAAFALKPGDYTKEPVQTQFGWHVIKVEEKRKAPKPTFDQVKEQIRQVLMREKYVALVDKARKTLKVQYVDPQVKQQVDQLEKAMEQGSADGDGSEAGGNDAGGGDASTSGSGSGN